MLTYYHIKNYKSLRNVNFAPVNLNLMLGLNSMGKSSVIQSLLLLRQSYYKNKDLSKLLLNGELVSLGSSNDVFFQDAGEDESLVYELNFGEKNNCLSFSYKNSLEYFSQKSISENGLFTESLFNADFHYLQADHIAPSLTYKKEDISLHEINILGNIGEFAPTYLSLKTKEKLAIEKLHNPNALADSLAKEVDAWMSLISPGVRISAEEIPGNLIKMGYQFETKDGYTSSYSPINVGFGVSYVLPLILTILISKPGDMIFIENPESHLHPRGQSELGKLLSLASQAGVQIFCETHSDHIVNGVRLAVHDKILDNKKVKLFYFDKNNETRMETSVISIHVDHNGELDKYPKGLLDEWGNVLAQLF